MSTRHRALEAAVNLVGSEGIRALTHGRVDSAAELPPGSTSNYFRTRAALLAGVIDWIADGERREAGETLEIRAAEDLVRMLTQLIEVQSGPMRWRTRARYALFLEAADDDAIAPLLRQRALFEDWVREILVRVGGPGAASGTLLLMASCDGLLLHRVTVNRHVPVAAAVSSAVATALRSPSD